MINLQGFTSTTRSRETAMDFAIGKLAEEDVNPEKCPVLVEIVIEGDNQLFSLYSEEYSAYSYEEEVLLQDGVEYTVIDC